MPLQLSIRDNRSAADFGCGAHRTYTFEALPIDVGTSAACHCRLEQSEGPDRLFRLQRGESPATFQVAVSDRNEKMYVNDRPVSSSTVSIRNGDEIRAGHLTFRFFRIPPAVPFSSKATALSAFAKALIGLILVCELAFAVWLPRQLKAAEVWQKQIAEQKTVMLIDTLKHRLKSAEASDKMTRAAQDLIEKAVKKKVAIVRKNRDRLVSEQWEQLRRELLTYSQLLNRVKRGEAWQPIPAVKLEEGVEALLKQAEEEPMFSPEPESRE